MQFYDEVNITIQSGKGGDGHTSGRREAYVAFGGPSGGDGGKGGDIIFEASKDENTLLAYKFKKKFKAKDGEPGRNKDQYGANAENLVLKVPLGTLVKDTETGLILYSFTKHGERRSGLKGGNGGLGNIHFKDAVNQFPNFSLLGEPGEYRELTLELQLLGDVALIGTPSVGKSTLINAVSNAKAKTAEYHFTTLIPNLGSVQVGDVNFNVVDVPGLIKGAAEGKGLGNAFLRHILKARVFCLMADISRYEKGISEVSELLGEIFTYVENKFLDNPRLTLDCKLDIVDGLLELNFEIDGENILTKKLIFVINKYDLVNDEEVLAEYSNQFYDDIISFFKEKIGIDLDIKLLKDNTFVMSAATRQGLEPWLNKMQYIISTMPAQELELEDNEELEFETEERGEFVIDITDIEKELLIEEGYVEEEEAGRLKVWQIDDKEFCRLTNITPWGNDEGELWFWKQIDTKGYRTQLEEAGVMKGDVLKVISYYHGRDDKYIMY